MTFILPLNMQFFKKAIIFVFLPVIKIVSWIKATSQSSNIVRMHSLGKSYENRDLYILQVSLIKCNNRYGGLPKSLNIDLLTDKRRIKTSIQLISSIFSIIQIQANHQVIKPLVFINCGTHAREWISPASCIYIIDQVGKTTFFHSQK